MYYTWFYKYIFIQTQTNKSISFLFWQFYRNWKYFLQKLPIFWMSIDSTYFIHSMPTPFTYCERYHYHRWLIRAKRRRPLSLLFPSFQVSEQTAIFCAKFLQWLLFATQDGYRWRFKWTKWFMTKSFKCIAKIGSISMQTQRKKLKRSRRIVMGMRVVLAEFCTSMLTFHSRGVTQFDNGKICLSRYIIFNF